MVARANPNEISIIRVYDAPLTKVWDAWTIIEQVEKWWGPRGFTLTTHSRNLQPGGIWHYTMHGPDGVDYPNKTLYHEVEKCAKLVYDHGGYDDRPPLFRATVLFSESQGKTTVDMTMSLPTAEQAATIRQRIKDFNGNSTWDRLAEYLHEKEDKRHSFVINRSFAAPVDLVFEMWTNPDHLARWQPPVGFRMHFLRTDLREGGSCFFQMTNDAGVALFAQFDYLEITKPCRIVYLQRFCDADGNDSRHPGLPEFPAAMKTSVIFAVEGDNATRVTVVSETFDQATAREIEVFRNERPGMTMGWTGSFNELDTLLESAGISSTTQPINGR